MLPLDRDPHFTFRFQDDRIISRIYLEVVGIGERVSIFAINPITDEKLQQLATGTVGAGGWVDLPEPIIVRAGGVFQRNPGREALDCVPSRPSPSFAGGV